MILSIIVIVRAGVKSTNVVCPHNGHIFAIFSKTGFVDTAPLFYKASIYRPISQPEIKIQKNYSVRKINIFDVKITNAINITYLLSSGIIYFDSSTP